MSEMSEMATFKEFAFNDQDLRTEALTHKSYVYENPMTGYHNERLEFLGDSVVSCVISYYLYDKFRDYKEGQLTTLKAQLVCRQTLSQFAKQLGLNNHLKLGAGATFVNGRNNEKILEDTFEAYVGAIFLDSDKSYVKVIDFLEPLLTPKINYIIEESKKNNTIDASDALVGPKDGSVDSTYAYEDPINRLQTWSQRRGFGIPKYNEVGRSGTDNDVQFTFEVLVNNESYGSGTARNKREARKLAALDAFNSKISNLC